MYEGGFFFSLLRYGGKKKKDYIDLKYRRSL